MKKEQFNPKKDVSRRLRIVEGHLRKIIDMVDSDAYCIDILQQTAAVKSAIKKAEEVLLSNHLNHCVVRAITSDRKEKAIEELTQVFRKMN